MRARHALILLAACLPGAALATDPVLKVSPVQQRSLGIQTVLVQPATEVFVRRLPGTVSAPLARSGVVTVPYAGVVVSVEHLEGEDVRAGTALAVVQSGEVLQWSAMAQRASAEAMLANTRAKRDQALLAEGVVARARVEESQARARQAGADLSEAQRALALAPRGRAAPGQYELRAPLTGRVLRRDVQPGDAVSAGQSAFLVGEGDVLDVSLRVPVAVAARLRTGMTARLAGGSVRGTIVAVAAATAAGSPTVPVRARFSRDAGLLIGQQVAIDVAMPAVAGSWRVPTAAVVRQGDVAYVFVQATGGYRAVQVAVLGEATQGLVVRGALRADERVAVTATTALMSLLAAG